MMHSDGVLHHIQQSRSRSTSPTSPRLSAEQLVALFTEKESARRIAIERKREEVEKSVYAECTFKPNVRQLPRPRAEDRVEVSLPSADCDFTVEGGDSAVWKKGVVLRIGSGGCYDVMCGEGQDEQEYTNIPPSRVRRAIYVERASVLSSSRSRTAQREKSSEQKEIETHCTFQPSCISSIEPFISERTLRTLNRSTESMGGGGIQRSRNNGSYAGALATPSRGSPAHRSHSGAPSTTTVLSKRSPRSTAPPVGRARSASSEAAAVVVIRRSSIDTPLPHHTPLNDTYSAVRRKEKEEEEDDVVQFLGEVCGNYLIGGGLVEEPPRILGVPVYYFDRLNPPSFEKGTCLSKLTGPPPAALPKAPSSAGLQDIAGIPFAPPVPDWAWGRGGDPNRGKSLDEVASGGSTPFQRLTPKAEAPKASGWSLIMEEMAAKRDGILKKKEEAPKEKAKDEKATPGKLAKSGKKGRRKSTFEDVIGELQYTLAKMRGEITEEDEMEEEEEEAPPLPSKSSTPVKTPMKTPQPAQAAAPPPTKEIESTLASLGGPPKPPPTPPPLPSTWPPQPYTGAAQEQPKKEEPKAKQNTNIAYSLLQKPLHTISAGPTGGHVMTSELPFGYFISGVSTGMVGPGQIVPGGIVTAQLVKTFRRVFELRATEGGIGRVRSSSAGSNDGVLRQSPPPLHHQATARSTSPPQRPFSPSVITFSAAVSPSPQKAHQHFTFENRPILTGASTSSPVAGTRTPNSNEVSRVVSLDLTIGSASSHFGLDSTGAQDPSFLTPYAGYSPDKSVATEDSPQLTDSSAASSRTSRRSAKLYPTSPGASIHKLTINDLPLPPNFYSAVQRLKLATKVRSQKKELEKSMSLRSYDIGSGGVPSTTIPQEPNFSINKRLELRYAKKCQEFVKSTISEMQQSAEEKGTEDSRGRSTSMRRESVIGARSMTPDGKIVSGRRESILAGSKRAIEIRSRSPEHRRRKDNRIAGREARRRREGEQQAESARKLKEQKERLHQQALLTARMVGCDPSKRKNRHEKLLQKYNVAPGELLRQSGGDPFLQDYMRRSHIIEQRPQTALNLSLDALEADEFDGYGELVPTMDDYYYEPGQSDGRYKF